MRKLLLLALPVAAAVAAIDVVSLLPLDHAAIQYEKTTPRDRAGILAQKLDKREVSLSYHPEFGYLKSLLQALHVPTSSQLLVFSKTSFQAPKIFPRMPRAIYHSDDVTVGYVRGGDVLEIASVDPQLGTVFYTLDQEQSKCSSRPKRFDCWRPDL